jgi:hypothetical protein
MGRKDNGRIAAPSLAFAMALLITLGGCAAGQSDVQAPVPHELGEARWVETTPQVRTLLVSPAPICEVARPGEDAAALAIGSFFARYDAPTGPVDQLALMIVLEGQTAAHILDSGLSLMLEIDGEVFTGQPGLGSNSVSWDPRNQGRATLAIPISPSVLDGLAQAEVVRGRIGAWATFDFPAPSRDRLRDVLRGLPEDFEPTVTGATVRALKASIS